MTELSRLIQTGADAAGDREDALWLLSSVLRRPRAELILNKNAAIDDSVAARFLSMCKRRSLGEPVQYITNSAEFMGLEFYVDERVLIPRADTETLCEYAISRGGARVLDLCCGSGCIGLAYKRFRPESEVTLADISEGALEVTRKNAEALGLSVRVLRADLFDCPFEDGAFDMILTNPPYIKRGDLAGLPREVRREPALALDGGDDGLDFYRALMRWKRVLAPGGELVAEAGFDTAEAVFGLFTEHFHGVTLTRDLSGVPRVIKGVK